MTSFTFTCLSFFCMVFLCMSLHLLCVRLCASEARAFFGSRCCSSSSFFMAIALARHHVTPSRHQIARTPSRHARVTPSRHQHCTHTITACSCDTFTASSLHTRTPSRHAHETHETPSRHLVLMMRHRRGIFRSRPAKGVGCLRKSETQ